MKVALGSEQGRKGRKIKLWKKERGYGSCHVLTTKQVHEPFFTCDSCSHRAANIGEKNKLLKTGDYVGMMFQSSGNVAKIF